MRRTQNRLRLPAGAGTPGGELARNEVLALAHVEVLEQRWFGDDDLQEGDMTVSKYFCAARSVKCVPGECCPP